MSEIAEIDVDALAALLDGGGVLLDVRETDEYTEAHVPGAYLVPLSELADRLDDVPTNDTVLVICRSGGRSMKACEFLSTRPQEFVNVAGGTLAWIASGRPVVAGPNRG